MKKVLIISLLLLMACSSLSTSLSQKSWAEQTLAKMTLREKIAQMMIYHMNMRFKDVPESKWDEIKNLIQTDGIGGIHLWYGDVSSSVAIMNKMQSMSKVPIIFDADIEYGLNQRFPSGTDLPPLMAITATDNPENAYAIGEIVANEARAVGIQWNLSPVVDVNNNPANPIINTRSFGENPEQVSRFAIQYMKGLQDNTVLATAKHFPGHGDTETDSHSALAMIPSDSARLWSVELPPFQAMSDAGVDAIMVAHVHAPDYQPESETPATLSKFWMQDILRNRIGFTGTIITDAMAMGGMVKSYSDAYALIKTIQAGSDVIIQNYHIKGSIDTVEKAVLAGEISEGRINQSALKMLKMKEKVGLHLNKNINLDNARDIFGNKENAKKIQTIASEAITCVRTDSELLPLAINGKDTLYVIDLYDREFEHSRSSITKTLQSEGVLLKAIQVDESDSKNILESIVNDIPKNARILINAFASPKAWKNRIFLPENETTFVHQLIDKSNRIILASMGTPYLLQEFPQITVYLCAYKGNSVMKTAMVKALLGQIKITGKLPVSIPNIAELGQGVIVEKRINQPKAKQYSPGAEIVRILPREIEVNIDTVMQLMGKAVQDSAWPGAVILGAKQGKIFLQEAVGFHTYAQKQKMRSSDIFDLASITKVISTTSAIMNLVDSKQIKLDDPIVKHLAAFKGKQRKYFEQKPKVTIRHLLTHTGGLPPFKRYYKINNKSGQAILDSVYNTEPIYGLEAQMKYSDVGLIVLGKMVEQITEMPLDTFVDSLIFEPLGMTSTFFNPTSEKLHRIVPTEYSPDGQLIHGKVHDENAYSLGGVAGHAGLFSTAKDLARFSQMMLNGGIYGWKRIFREETVSLFTKRANIIEGNSRCLGWDSPDGEASGGVYLSDQSFGHTGFTGTSLWIDPENDVIVILLTNAVHPNRNYKDPKYYEWRQKIHSSVYEILGFKEKNSNLKWKERW
ncbi:MAG: serine hydrolase [Candidatus Marinimicrobia bacterium]|nr:serine hydrolase [Candidatus Neomarinimicrobiota bacterium]MBT3691882.1 serine hydrolase [Candidatus Neomarinimicrobiota bacterium]MBT4990252.1 serine hydrolase [Candidatus Neomarinimicrobiota bacterium]MBT5404778.1 serine hydrolase [Candidatus Neomarinimicrobiota bacterium]MBT6158319.1 serine hydrolase [Candidatus Neomarinimicrobiota bacterium]